MRRHDICLVGTGPMAAQHIRVLAAMPQFNVVACASRRLESAQAFAAAHHIARARTLDDVLARPDADALWVSVAADAMLEVGLSLAALGLPLFLEKPVGLSPEETRQARAAIKVPHLVGLNRRFYDVIREGERLVAERGGLRFIEVHMPENIAGLDPRFSARTRAQWAFANSVHLIDLFRVFGGEVVGVKTANEMRSESDRSYSALLSFRAARGVYSAQWMAPGGWRLTLYADDRIVTYQPIERGIVQDRGGAPRAIEPGRGDTEFKPGLQGLAAAFAHLLETGRLERPAADLADYEKSVDLVAALTRVETQGHQ